MKSEMTTLAGEIVMLRSHLSDGSNADDVLHAKCTKLEVEREGYLSLLRESDRQLASARRAESDIEASLRRLCPGEGHAHPQL